MQRGLILVVLAGLLGAATFGAATPAAWAAAPSRVAQAAQNAPSRPAPAGQEEAAAPVDPAAALDSVRASLDKIEAQLAGDSMSDGELVKLRGALDPFSTQIQGVVAEVAPKLAAVKARLDQLGPPHDDKANPPAAPEDPVVTQERADLQKAVAANEDLVKRANVAQLRVDQIAAQIAERRRTLFANAVFQNSSSILSPRLWMDVARDTPHNLTATKSAIADLAGQISSAFSEGFAWRIIVAFILLFAALAVVSEIARRVIPRDKANAEPGELQKAAAALWIVVVVAAIPVAAIAAFVALGEWLGLSARQFKPLTDAIASGAVAVSLAIGLGNAILAPRCPSWRPIDLTDRVAQKLMNLLVVLTSLVALGRLIEAFDEIIGVSLSVSVAAKGAIALLVGVTIMRGLYGIVAASEDEEEAPGGRSAGLVDESPWWPIIRFGVWAATLAVIAADLLGYIALASFLVRQIAWTALVAGLLFLLLKLIGEAFEVAFRPGSRLSRGLVASVGLRRESVAQIGVLLSGLITLTLYAFAALLIVAPWGLQSHDIFGSIESAFFGFKIGDVTIAPWSLLVALALFGIGYAITGAVQGWLEKRYLPLTSIDQGLKASIRTSVGYVGLIASLAFASAYLGLNMEKLALVAGALSVGIGLGLQSVVNNFVSGLILLWERAIRVGDLIMVGGDQGFVRKISVRATEIETFDRATMIVPNGNMMTGVVKNFVRGDRVGRVLITVSVVWGADPEKVRDVLLESARAQDEVVGFPAPLVLFNNMSASSLDFDLICFVDDVARAGRVKSDLNFTIFKAFAEAGIRINPPASSQSVTIDPGQFAALTNPVPLRTEANTKT